MELRMQKAHILKQEIPELGMDIGGVVVKISFFDIKCDLKTLNESEGYEKELYVNVTPDKVENRQKLRHMLDEYFKTTFSHKINEIKIKDLIGTLHCCLFRREYFNEFLLKLNKLNLKRPYIVITGAALVNHMFQLEDQLNARVIIISSENESLIRGIEFLRTQSELLYELEFYKLSDLEYYNRIPKTLKDLSSIPFYPALLVVIGTSTTYMYLNSSTKYTFLSSSAISGQTFFGICNNIYKLSLPERNRNSTDVKTFQECVKMATDGRHDTYDSTMKHMCGDNEYKVEQYLYLHKLTKQKDEFIKEFADMPVSIFGEIVSKKPKDTKKLVVKSVNSNNSSNEINDFASATLNLICYQIAETMILYSKTLKINLVLCAGTFLTNNLIAKKLIAKYLNLLAHNSIAMETNKRRLYFLDNEAYLAAMGCVAMDTRNIESVSEMD